MAESTLNQLSESEIDEFNLQLRGIATSHSSSLEKIELSLGLNAGFVLALLEEKDDWAFIIKMSVVVEATLGRVINALVGNDQIARHIRSLPMDGRTGKIQLARDLNIVGPKSAARLRVLGEIRNDFAHDLRVVQVSISEYFSSMPSADFDAMAEKFFARDDGTKTPDARKPNRRLSSGPADGRVARSVLWSCGCFALLELSAAYRRISSQSAWSSALKTLGEAFSSRLTGDESAAREKMKIALAAMEATRDQ